MDSEQNNKSQESLKELTDILAKYLGISENFARRYDDVFMYLAENLSSYTRQHTFYCFEEGQLKIDGYRDTHYDMYHVYFAPREIRYDGKSYYYGEIIHYHDGGIRDPFSNKLYVFSEEEIEKYIREEAFVATLFKYIEKKNLDPVDVYKKANIYRRLFSKIRRKPDYMPSRRTAVAFAIALELTLEETDDLIGRAGFRLSDSIPFDVIIKYFIEKGNYNIFEINEVLFAFNQPLLGE